MSRTMKRRHKKLEAERRQRELDDAVERSNKYLSRIEMEESGWYERRDEKRGRGRHHHS